MAETFKAKERLFKTVDGRIVPEGHPDAATLVAIPEREIPMAEAIELGLVKGLSLIHI